MAPLPRRQDRLLTGQQRLLQEKERLLQEIHHRVQAKALIHQKFYQAEGVANLYDSYFLYPLVLS